MAKQKICQAAISLSQTLDCRQKPYAKEQLIPDG